MTELDFGYKSHLLSCKSCTVEQQCENGARLLARWARKGVAQQDRSIKLGHRIVIGFVEHGPRTLIPHKKEEKK